MCQETVSHTLAQSPCSLGSLGLKYSTVIDIEVEYCVKGDKGWMKVKWSHNGIRHSYTTHH